MAAFVCVREKQKEEKQRVLNCNSFALKECYYGLCVVACVLVNLCVCQGEFGLAVQLVPQSLTQHRV